MAKFECALFFHLLICGIELICALKGPHPSDLPPESYASSGLKNVDIPLIKPACGRSSPPNLTLSSLTRSYYNFNMYVFYVQTDWCSTPEGKLRFRLLEYGNRKIGNGTAVPFTKVLQARVKSGLSDYSLFQRRCHRYNVYVEVCARKSESLRPLCSMTEIKQVKQFVVPQPRLKFRPPYELRLSPGDHARIETEIVNASSRSEGFSNGGYDTDKRRFLLRSVIRSKSGKILFSSRQREGTRSVAYIRGWQTRAKKGAIFDGATAFLKFAKLLCPSNEGSFEDIYATKIVVRNDVKHLVQQDYKLPEFRQPTFPLARINETVEITVNAKNVGGGVREDGVSTKLEYRWFIRTEDFRFGPTYAQKIEGETSPTLRIENATCKYLLGGRHGISNLQQYYVDVCNTYGCKRSQKIEPEFLSVTPGKKIGSNCYLADA